MTKDELQTQLDSLLAIVGAATVNKITALSRQIADIQVREAQCQKEKESPDTKSSTTP